jgi:transcriptional regulator with XRE-family HTH domain
MATPTVSKSTRRTTDIDRALAARVRERRIMLGLTQQQLAELIGVTYQQAHKYELGLNRIGVARLLAICHVLGTTVAELLADLDSKPRRSALRRDQLSIARDLAVVDGFTRTAVAEFVHKLAKRAPCGLPGSLV